MEWVRVVELMRMMFDEITGRTDENDEITGGTDENDEIDET
ncbi:hypothetical protein [Paenibacillus fonticola]|nr:hypothetical protein [Paenibacillus fonticola]